MSRSATRHGTAPWPDELLPERPKPYSVFLPPIIVYRQIKSVLAFHSAEDSRLESGLLYHLLKTRIEDAYLSDIAIKTVADVHNEKPYTFNNDVVANRGESLPDGNRTPVTEPTNEIQLAVSWDTLVVKWIEILRDTINVLLVKKPEHYGAQVFIVTEMIAMLADDDVLLGITVYRASTAAAAPFVDAARAMFVHAREILYGWTKFPNPALKLETPPLHLEELGNHIYEMTEAYHEFVKEEGDMRPSIRFHNETDAGGTLVDAILTFVDSTEFRRDILDSEEWQLFSMCYYVAQMSRLHQTLFVPPATAAADFHRPRFRSNRLRLLFDRYFNAFAASGDAVRRGKIYAKGAAVAAELLTISPVVALILSSLQKDEVMEQPDIAVIARIHNLFHTTTPDDSSSSEEDSAPAQNNDLVLTAMGLIPIENPRFADDKGKSLLGVVKQLFLDATPLGIQSPDATVTQCLRAIFGCEAWMRSLLPLAVPGQKTVDTIPRTRFTDVLQYRTGHTKFDDDVNERAATKVKLDKSWPLCDDLSIITIDGEPLSALLDPVVRPREPDTTDGYVKPIGSLEYCQWVAAKTLDEYYGYGYIEDGLFHETLRVSRDGKREIGDARGTGPNADTPLGMADDDSEFYGAYQSAADITVSYDRNNGTTAVFYYRRATVDMFTDSTHNMYRAEEEERGPLVTSRTVQRPVLRDNQLLFKKDRFLKTLHTLISNDAHADSKYTAVRFAIGASKRFTLIAEKDVLTFKRPASYFRNQALPVIKESGVRVRRDFDEMPVYTKDTDSWAAKYPPNFFQTLQTRNNVLRPAQSELYEDLFLFYFATLLSETDKKLYVDAFNGDNKPVPTMEIKTLSAELEQDASSSSDTDRPRDAATPLYEYVKPEPHDLDTADVGNMEAFTGVVIKDDAVVRNIVRYSKYFVTVADTSVVLPVTDLWRQLIEWHPQKSLVVIANTPVPSNIVRIDYEAGADGTGADRYNIYKETEKTKFKNESLNGAVPAKQWLDRTTTATFYRREAEAARFARVAVATWRGDEEQATLGERLAPKQAILDYLDVSTAAEHLLVLYNEDYGATTITVRRDTNDTLVFAKLDVTGSLYFKDIKNLNAETAYTITPTNELVGDYKFTAQFNQYEKTWEIYYGEDDALGDVAMRLDAAGLIYHMNRINAEYRGNDILAQKQVVFSLYSPTTQTTHLGLDDRSQFKAVSWSNYRKISLQKLNVVERTFATTKELTRSMSGVFIEGENKRVPATIIPWYFSYDAQETKLLEQDTVRIKVFNKEKDIRVYRVVGDDNTILGWIRYKNDGIGITFDKEAFIQTDEYNDLKRFLGAPQAEASEYGWVTTDRVSTFTARQKIFYDAAVAWQSPTDLALFLAPADVESAYLVNGNRHLRVNTNGLKDVTSEFADVTRDLTRVKRFELSLPDNPNVTWREEDANIKIEYVPARMLLLSVPLQQPAYYYDLVALMDSNNRVAVYAIKSTPDFARYVPLKDALNGSPQHLAVLESLVKEDKPFEFRLTRFTAGVRTQTPVTSGSFTSYLTFGNRIHNAYAISKLLQDKIKERTDASHVLTVTQNGIAQLYFVDEDLVTNQKECEAFKFESSIRIPTTAGVDFTEFDGTLMYRSKVVNGTPYIEHRDEKIATDSFPLYMALRYHEQRRTDSYYLCAGDDNPVAYTTANRVITAKPVPARLPKDVIPTDNRIPISGSIHLLDEEPDSDAIEFAGTTIIDFPAGVKVYRPFLAEHLYNILSTEKKRVLAAGLGVAELDINDQRFYYQNNAFVVVPGHDNVDAAVQRLVDGSSHPFTITPTLWDENEAEANAAAYGIKDQLQASKHEGTRIYVRSRDERYCTVTIRPSDGLTRHAVYPKARVLQLMNVLLSFVEQRSDAAADLADDLDRAATISAEPAATDMATDRDQALIKNRFRAFLLLAPDKASTFYWSLAEKKFAKTVELQLYHSPFVSKDLTRLLFYTANRVIDLRQESGGELWRSSTEPYRFSQDAIAPYVEHHQLLGADVKAFVAVRASNTATSYRTDLSVIPDSGITPVADTSYEFRHLDGDNRVLQHSTGESDGQFIHFTEYGDIHRSILPIMLHALSKAGTHTVMMSSDTEAFYLIGDGNKTQPYSHAPSPPLGPGNSFAVVGYPNINVSRTGQLVLLSRTFTSGLNATDTSIVATTADALYHIYAFARADTNVPESIITHNIAADTRDIILLLDNDKRQLRGICRGGVVDLPKYIPLSSALAIANGGKLHLGNNTSDTVYSIARRDGELSVPGYVQAVDAGNDANYVLLILYFGGLLNNDNQSTVFALRADHMYFTVLSQNLRVDHTRDVSGALDHVRFYRDGQLYDKESVLQQIELITATYPVLFRLLLTKKSEYFEDIGVFGMYVPGDQPTEEDEVPIPTPVVPDIIIPEPKNEDDVGGGDAAADEPLPGPVRIKQEPEPDYGGGDAVADEPLPGPAIIKREPEDDVGGGEDEPDITPRVKRKKPDDNNNNNNGGGPADDVKPEPDYGGGGDAASEDNPDVASHDNGGGPADDVKPEPDYGGGGDAASEDNAPRIKKEHDDKGKKRADGDKDASIVVKKEKDDTRSASKETGPADDDDVIFISETVRKGHKTVPRVRSSDVIKKKKKEKKTKSSDASPNPSTSSNPSPTEHREPRTAITIEDEKYGTRETLVIRPISGDGTRLSHQLQWLHWKAFVDGWYETAADFTTHFTVVVRDDRILVPEELEARRSWRVVARLKRSQDAAATVSPKTARGDNSDDIRSGMIVSASPLSRIRDVTDVGIPVKFTAIGKSEYVVDKASGRVQEFKRDVTLRVRTKAGERLTQSQQLEAMKTSASFSAQYVMDYVIDDRVIRDIGPSLANIFVLSFRANQLQPFDLVPTRALPPQSPRYDYIKIIKKGSAAKQLVIARRDNRLPLSETDQKFYWHTLKDKWYESVDQFMSVFEVTEDGAKISKEALEQYTDWELGVHSAQKRRRENEPGSSESKSPRQSPNDAPRSPALRWQEHPAIEFSKPNGEKYKLRVRGKDGTQLSPDEQLHLIKTADDITSNYIIDYEDDTTSVQNVEPVLASRLIDNIRAYSFRYITIDDMPNIMFKFVSKEDPGRLIPTTSIEATPPTHEAVSKLVTEIATVYQLRDSDSEWTPADSDTVDIVKSALIRRKYNLVF